VKGSGQPRIMFLTQWNYEEALVQTYTLPYIAIIKRIRSSYCYLITIGKSGRLNIKKCGDNILIELPVPKRFFRLRWLFNIIILNKIIKKKQVQIVHTWCTPAGSVGVLLKVLHKQIKLILDSVEPHAESMVECNIWHRQGLKFRVLFYLEKLQFKKADTLIFAASGMDKYIRDKYNLQVTGYIKPACVDFAEFSKKYVKDKALLEQLNLEDKIVCVYAGKFGGFYLENETFEFIKQCEQYWSNKRFKFLLLSNISDEYLNYYLQKNNIDKKSVIKLFVPHTDIPKYIGLADFAICPNKPVPSKRYGTPIKNGEYWAMGLPIVIPPNISDDSDIIKTHGAGAILEGFTPKDYYKTIKQIDSIISSKTREEIYSMVRPVAEKYRNFRIAEEVYSKIYASCL
jgi:hypothetical protein